MPPLTHRKCIIPGCHDLQNKSVTLFKFPKDEDTRRRWVIFVKCHVNDGEPRITTQSRLCSQHFTKDSFQNFHRRDLGFTDRPLLLVDGAEPNVILGPPTSGSGASVCSTSPPGSMNLPTPIKTECQLSEGTLTNISNTECQQQQVFKEEQEEEEEEKKVLADQQLCVQERTSSVDHQDPEPPQIKEEPEELCIKQEEEQFEVKQEPETFPLAPYEESDHSGDQTLSFSANGVDIVVEEKPLSDTSLMNSIKSETNTDHQLLSDNKDGDPNLERDSEIPCDTHTNNRPFKCHICGEDFRFSSFWSRHQKVHAVRDPCVCKICGRTMYDMSALKRHIRIHTGEKPYSCEVCGKDFRFKGGLEVHMRIHRDEKPFLCNTCGKSFRCLGILNAHIRVHTGERPYVCKTCDKGFSGTTALKRHMRSHTGEKPYHCDICGRDFRYRSGFQGHMKSAHDGEFEKL